MINTEEEKVETENLDAVLQQIKGGKAKGYIILLADEEKITRITNMEITSKVEFMAFILALKDASEEIIEHVSAAVNKGSKDEEGGDDE